MPDFRNALRSKYEPSNRFQNFSDILTRLTVNGFRGHETTIIDVRSPITAFCGLNGTGKSTLLQLAACAYKNTSDETSQYYIKDFFVSGGLDPNPFTSTASVEYQYWQEDRKAKTLTISRNSETKRWQGYTRRPSRSVLFAGVGAYLPRIEQRDFVIRHYTSISLKQSSNVSQQIRQKIGGILGIQYDNVCVNHVQYQERTGRIVSVSRSGRGYSEAHMGYGEGRVQHLVAVLEILPEKSLVLIEEPETSLHGSAQHKLGKYLVMLCNERHHQIFLTTHSEALLAALPSESRIYLHRDDQGVHVVPGITAVQASSLMSEGHLVGLHVLVEDEVAAAVFTELVRRLDPSFLQTLKVTEVGDHDSARRTLGQVRNMGVRAAAVLDADQSARPSDNIFRLPGNQAPERELSACQNVKECVIRLGINLDDFRCSLQNDDHHDWPSKLSDLLNMTKHALIYELAKAYAQSVPESELDALIKQLKEAASH